MFIGDDDSCVASENLTDETLMAACDERPIRFSPEVSGTKCLPQRTMQRNCDRVASLREVAPDFFGN